MPLFKTLDNRENCKVAVWAITESVDELLSMLNLNNKDLVQLNSFKLDRRKIEWLATRVLSQSLINEIVTVSYKENGRPFLENSDWNISFSHTKGFAAVAISKNCIPGIDIEIPSDRVLKVKERFLSSEERNFTDEKDEMVSSTIIWAAKEAIFKMIEKPDLIFNTEVSIATFQPQSAGELSATIRRKDLEADFQLKYCVNDHFCLVWSV